MPLPARLVGQSTRQIRLADPRRPADQHVLVIAHPAPGHQTGEQSPVESARMPEIDIFWRRRLFQPGAFQTRRILSRLAFGGLAVDQQPEALLERQLADLGALRLAGQGPGHARQAQLVESLDGRMIQHGKAPSVVVTGATHIAVLRG
jgi:hypothetical protein